MWIWRNLKLMLLRLAELWSWIRPSFSSGYYWRLQRITLNPTLFDRKFPNLSLLLKSILRIFARKTSKYIWFSNLVDDLLTFSIEYNSFTKNRKCAQNSSERDFAQFPHCESGNYEILLLPFSAQMSWK